MRIDIHGVRHPDELEVSVDDGDPTRLRWSVANRGDAPFRVGSVAIEVYVHSSDPRMFRNGYQSWSASGGALVGRDRDPSTATGSLRFVRNVHHADPEVAVFDELRSEQVTVLHGDDETLLVGFAGGDRHDGTVRVRAEGGDVRLRAEAYLGGAVLAPGERRELHDVIVWTGDDPSVLLERWAALVGRESRARVDAPCQVGWCSWYHYFHGVTETDVRANLGHAREWPFDVFQLDDGYQANIGDWLDTNEKFTTPLDQLAADVDGAGFVPGIWLAPFLAHPESAVVRAHPEWVARWTDGQRPLIGSVNDAWGGQVMALDTTQPEVLAHIEATARGLVERGWRYLKLDFTYAPSFEGVWADAAQTPAERVRAGFEAVRRGAGDDVFLLGCGAPMGHAIGVVDGMRIGPDVAPWWAPQADQWRPPGYVDTEPATLNAWRNTLSRSFMHRRLWLNDPDCLMLRTTKTRMTPEAMRAWAFAVAASGGMALVSDDLALLDRESRALLDEVIAIGREVDAASVTAPPVCPDLLDAATPAQLRSAVCELAGEPLPSDGQSARYSMSLTRQP